MKDKTKTRDYFAEMYIAGILADNEWNVYFPHRDIGFDFIVTKEIGQRIMVRPVQVKGKYPERDKTDKRVYGFIGKLTQVHEDMVLAIPFFSKDQRTKSPDCIAFIPRSRIIQKSRGYASQPAQFIGGKATPRRDYAKYFDTAGIQNMESEYFNGRASKAMEPTVATVKG